MSKEVKKTVVTQANVGQFVEFYDPRGRMFPALITAVHGPQCINLVYVNDVEGQKDTYGQKLLRNTSCMHGSIQQAWGNYWLLPDEERLPPLPAVEDSAKAPE